MVSKRPSLRVIVQIIVLAPDPKAVKLVMNWLATSLLGVYVRQPEDPDWVR